ncbi:MAG: uracil-DNA glycosylase [Verrucomicrobia bacterium]|nr:uracil-DNA glycosylase [Verrucomicrobiota bacterium]MCH8513731.1 uracil-DNA glycosylase [Kiritimatiellia bacterium]
MDPKIEEGWKAELQPAFEEVSFANLKAFLLREKELDQPIYPPGSRIFAAFDHTPWDQVRVVILGQDPYHGPGQANGLCFSVSPGVPPPPSLKNIFKELHDDLGLPIPPSGDLTPWARQGVLLLNATLTVRAHQAGSHQNQGWEAFTDAVVERLNTHTRRLVFVLWGSYARRKAAGIDRKRHRVLESPHPSPLSAHRGFFGSKPFSRINAVLREWGEPEIDWDLG